MKRTKQPKAAPKPKVDHRVSVLTPVPLSAQSPCSCCGATTDAACACALFAWCRLCRYCPVHCRCAPHATESVGAADDAGSVDGW